jgi:methionyl-tRNA formyltransferase
MRLAFMGSPEFSVPVLAEVIAAGHEVVCVYSQPARPAGRGQSERKTAVHAFAQAQGLEVRTPRTLKTAEEQAAFAALDLDLAVVVAYGLILPKPILDAPRLGCVNLHASLLPRWRGAAPIQRAIMAGDTVTGVQAMQMEEGLDTGPILLSASVSITPEDTAQTLHDRLSATGASLIPVALAGLERGSIVPMAQSDSGVTYASKITRDEARIDWNAPADTVRNHVHGLSPFPGAWFDLPTEKGAVRVKVLNASVEAVAHGAAPGTVLDEGLLVACDQGALRLGRVQREGRAALSATEFLRGTPVPAGTRLDY